MLIHIENAMKAHQHISYCSCEQYYLISIQRDHLKKNNFNTKSEQNIHQDALHKLHIFKKNSRRVACPLACVQLISLFLYEKKNIFFIQNAIKIYTKTHQL